jgi:hypothetical protein
MPFVTIPSGSIDIGDPITKDLWDKVKANEDDLNTRLTAVEGSAAKIEVFDGNVYLGVLASTLTGIFYYVAKENFTLTACRLRIYEKAPITGGTLEIDVKVNGTFNDTGMASVFTTRPSVNFATASDYDFSTNQVFDNTKINITANQVLRIDITSLPSTGGFLGKFYLQFYGEVS